MMGASAAPLADPWHYPRPDLAERMLQAFGLGLASARGLFARRRMGKTVFLTVDLLPAARAAGYLAAYTNLWEDTPHPGQAIAGAVLAAVEPRGVQRIWKLLHTPVKSVKGSGKVAGLVDAGLEVSLDAREKVAVPALRQALQAADARRKPLLLVVDEAQVLARPEHAAFAHALRSGLDTRKERIKVVFAGSSETALRDMLGKPSAPFYNWAIVEPFELLGGEFVRALVRHANTLARRRLALADAEAAFEALNRTPQFLRWYLERYLLEQARGPAAALAHTRERIHDELGFARTWAALIAADRALLLLLARGRHDLHGAAALAHLGELLGLGEPAKVSVVQNALRRLCSARLGLLARLEHGRYRFESSEFEEWVRLRDALG
jgi:hypothetical protein